MNTSRPAKSTNSRRHLIELESHNVGHTYCTYPVCVSVCTYVCVIRVISKTMAWKNIHTQKLLFKRRHRSDRGCIPTFLPQTTVSLYLILGCHLRTWRSHRGTQAHTSKYRFIWSASLTSGISLLVINTGRELKQGFILLELSGEVQSCIYHLCLCHPHLINCVSCQWRTMKVATEIKKNKPASRMQLTRSTFCRAPLHFHIPDEPETLNSKYEP